jgi:DNA-binding winged helix-turn-helix (wHTH) protein/tetratricopeptide (TPR) repeat protein
MSTSPKNSSKYRFGSYEVDSAEGILFRKGVQVKLQDLPFRLLVFLVERPAEIVTREELRAHLWPENTFVEFDNSLSVAIRKVREALDDDSEGARYIETVPRRGYRFIASVACTALLPARASEDIPSYNGEPKVGELPEPNVIPSKTRKSAAIFVTVFACVVVAMGIAIYKFRPRRAPSAAEAATAVSRVPVRRSVAVLGFRNVPGRLEDNWLSTAFSEMLNTELAAGGGLRMVSGEDVARAERELPLTLEETLARPTLERLRTNPGADFVVLGSYTKIPSKQSRIRLDLRVQDTASGETIAEEAVTGSEENLFELASEAGAQIRRNLNLTSAPEQAATAARASLPSNQRALQFYAEARAKMWQFDFAVARELLEKAVAADPKYPLARSALAEAWSRLGYSVNERAEAKRALELSANLPQEDRLLVEAEERKSVNDWSKAVQSYQELFAAFPDNLDYGLKLASSQVTTNPADSRHTLDTLRRLPAPAGDDARIDLLEASAWIGEDFARAQTAAQHAIEKGSARGSHLLVARAYGVLCQQASSVGTSTEKGITNCEQARQSYAEAGDQDNEARTLSDFAGILFLQGDLEKADGMWNKAAKEFRQVGDIEGVAATLNNLGGVHLSQGYLSKAKQLLEQAIPNYRTTEDKDGEALALNDLGDVARQSGNLAVATLTYQRGLTTARQIDDKNATAYLVCGLGDVSMDRGDLAAARKFYEQSLALRTQVGEQQAVGETQVALAKLTIEDGHAGDAEAVMGKYKQQFQQEHQADDEVASGTVLIEALLAEGKAEDANKEAEKIAPLASKSQNRLARLRFRLASARVLLASDQPESSRPQLGQVLNDARSHGLSGIEFEARLALAQLDKKSGRETAARLEFASLERAARAKGFGLVAGKAAAARG